MQLAELLENLDVREVQGPIHTAIAGIATDSRKTKRGDIFVAIHGHATDGHRYIRDAIARGARSVICETPVETPRGIARVLVEDARDAVSRLAHDWYGRPSETLRVIGVTGTNGKTTVCYMTRFLFNACGIRAGMMGTVCTDLGRGEEPSTQTTADPLALHRHLHGMLRNHCRVCVMEVSSHGLVQSRTRDVRFAAACFTNLSGDHMDYHGSLEAYAGAKGRLFQQLGEEGTAVLNRDDKQGVQYAACTRGRILFYGLHGNCDLYAEMEGMDLHGIKARISMKHDTSPLHLPFLGRYNLYNALAALGIGASQGLSLDEMCGAMSKAPPVPGRLEMIRVGGQPFHVFVDYAHTDDALRSVLRVLHQLCKRKLTVVFGCGGDRDRSKRPRMAQAAEQYADLAIVTSDNPRSENPRTIISEITRGFRGRASYVVEEDRQRAIRTALARSRADDVVLIAGKGHEDYQEIQGERFPFDDRCLARAILREMFGC